MVSSEHASASAYAGDVSPREAWQALSQNPRAVLVDVRTHAEWIFAGAPDLSSIGKVLAAVSWKLYPQFDRNLQFIAQLNAVATDTSAPLYFLCKTGGRSLDAALAATEAGYRECYNIINGFEGDSNPSHQRGKLSGWKADGLPWNQA